MKTRTFIITIIIVVLVFTLFFITTLGVVILAGKKGPFMITSDKVGIIEIEGIILDSDEIIKQIEEYAEDNSIKAIVIRINSPGGAVAPSQEIYEELKKLKKKGKKVLVSMGSIAASGGYYIAAAADKIFANPGTITGSIGVIMTFSNMEGLLKKVGMKYVVIKSGKHKDIGSFARDMTEEERNLLQTLLDDVHEQFINAISTGRNIPREQIKAIADGRIFSGKKAMDYKFVDHLGNFQDVIFEAARISGIKGKPTLVYPRKKLTIYRLLKGKINNIWPAFPLGEGIRHTNILYLME